MTPASPSAPLLTIGVPALNEERTLERCLTGALANAASLAGRAAVEILVIDDGSTDATAASAAALLGDRGRVLSQPNQGRSATRRRILAEARGDYVLLLDAHVALASGALRWWYDEGRPAPLTGDVTTQVATPYAAFWEILTAFGWRRYLADRKPVAFGVEDFDAYPKGTGMFLARRTSLLAAYVASGLEESTASGAVSDDTRLLRALAAEEKIRLHPEFRGVYVPPRSTLRQFLANARYRGETFVDSYWESPSVVGRAVRTAPVALGVGLVGLGLVGRHSWKAAGGLLLSGSLAPSAGVAALALNTGAPARQGLESALLAPGFTIAFGSGLLNGYLARIRRRRPGTRTASAAQR
jgi:glycosyltransferase involved in cell wall biosynthesis